MASITVATDGGEEKFPLDAASVTLGRGLESDVRLKDIKASRRHCQIVKVEAGFQVVDLSSGNGTYVNGVQIKQQLLHSGDKIQIGSTTITFLDAPSRPPQAAPPAARPVPVPAPVPVPPLAEPSASSPTSSTKAVPPRKSATVRSLSASGSTRSAPKVLADKRSEGARKSSPAGLVIGVIAVVFLGVVGAILFTASGDSVEQLRAAIRALETEAAEADKAGRLDQAASKYREVLAKIEGKEKFKGDTVRVRGLIAELGERKAQQAAAARRFAEIKARAAAAKDEEAAALAREARQLLSDAAGADFGSELREIADRLEKAGARKSDVQARKNELRDRHALEGPAPRYGDAIADWQAWSSEKASSEEDRQKVQAEITALNQKAQAELAKLKERAAGLEKDNKKAEAIEELKKQRDRFRLTGSADELESVISRLEK